MSLSEQRALIDARDLVWERIKALQYPEQTRAAMLLLHVWYYLQVQLGHKVPPEMRSKYGNKEEVSPIIGEGTDHRILKVIFPHNS